MSQLLWAPEGWDLPARVPFGCGGDRMGAYGAVCPSAPGHGKTDKHLHFGQRAALCDPGTEVL